MASDKAVPRLNAQILEEAASWFIDVHEQGMQTLDRAAFDRWLRTSPEHVRAYLQISAFWEEAGYLRGSRTDDALELLNREGESGNVFHLESAMRLPTEREQGASPRRRSRRQWAIHKVGIAAGIAALCLGVATTAAWLHARDAVTYSTQIGEQRSITLEDGSHVELNAKSRLRVQFTERVRTVELLEGQALFQVAKNAARPFIVRSDATSIRAVGTQFDVNRRRGRTVVTVVEGRVAVSNAGHAAAVVPAGNEGQRTLLSAGEQVTVNAREVTPPQPANVDSATAWTQKQLVFDTAPLSEVVEEFNRHNRRQLIVDDSQLNELHVSGVFASTDSQRVVRFLRQRFGVIVDERDDQIRIRRRQ